MSTPRIRAASEADLDAMTGLIGRLFALEPDFIFDPVKARRALGQLLAKQDAALWVADQGDRVVGMCTAQILVSTAEGGAVAWVEDVVVSPDLRGNGIGQLLLEAVNSWAKRRGVSRLQLLVDQENSPALDFYHRLDWRATRLTCLRLRPGA